MANDIVMCLTISVPLLLLWGGSEILHIMQEGEPLHFALPVCLSLNSSFLVPRTVHSEPTEGLPCDLFCVY